MFILFHLIFIFLLLVTFGRPSQLFVSFTFILMFFLFLMLLLGLAKVPRDLNCIRLNRIQIFIELLRLKWFSFCNRPEMPRIYMLFLYYSGLQSV